jgi:hypothetical protein
MGKEFENAAGTLARLRSPGRLAILDASLKENHGIVDTTKVEGYPAFLLYRNGRHVLSYGGLRTESHFVEYMLQKNAPLMTSVDKLEELLTFFRSHFDPMKESIEREKDTQTDTDNTAHYFFVGMMSSKGDKAASYEKMEAYHKLIEDVSARNDNMHIHFLFTG